MQFITLTLDDGRCVAIRADHIIHVRQRINSRGSYLGVTNTDTDQEYFSVTEKYDYILETIRTHT